MDTGRECIIMNPLRMLPSGCLMSNGSQHTLIVIDNDESQQGVEASTLRQLVIAS
jgi:hypothetical protein